MSHFFPERLQMTQNFVEKCIAEFSVLEISPILSRFCESFWGAHFQNSNLHFRLLLCKNFLLVLRFLSCICRDTERPLEGMASFPASNLYDLALFDQKLPCYPSWRGKLGDLVSQQEDTFAKKKFFCEFPHKRKTDMFYCLLLKRKRREIYLSVWKIATEQQERKKCQWKFVPLQWLLFQSLLGL